MSDIPVQLDVFSLDEVARAAGVDVLAVERLARAGHVQVLPGGLIRGDAAVAAIQALRSGSGLAVAPSGLFDRSGGPRREAGGPVAATTAAHVLILGAVVFLTTVGAAGPKPAAAPEITRLVFLTDPGPGGGGGGGGLRTPKPAARAERRGSSALRSPVPKPAVAGPKEEPVRRPDPPPAPEPVETVVDPPPPPREPDPPPPVRAPVATATADDVDRTGVPTDTAPGTTQGQGSGGGAGTGNGTGMGEGNGAGIGEGTGGGTGGGPYRPGAGITPPSLLREVRPDYTEEARQRGLTGDVELEIVVRSDGTVGAIRLLRGLGGGLDQRAVDAVRQWRFSPARRYGTPVDVMVEVAVEFRLR